MTYNKPELNQVGVAEELVLGLPGVVIEYDEQGNAFPEETTMDEF